MQRDADSPLGRSRLGRTSSAVHRDVTLVFPHCTVHSAPWSQRPRCNRTGRTCSEERPSTLNALLLLFALPKARRAHSLVKARSLRLRDLSPESSRIEMYVDMGGSLRLICILSWFVFVLLEENGQWTVNQTSSGRVGACYTVFLLFGFWLIGGQNHF